MRTIALLTSIAMAVLPIATHAQDAPPPTTAPVLVAPPSVMDGLDLSSAQRTQVALIAADARARLHTALGRRDPRTPLTPAQRVTQAEIVAEQRAALRRLLTPEQLLRLDQNLAARLDAATTSAPPPAP